MLFFFLACFYIWVFWGACCGFLCIWKVPAEVSTIPSSLQLLPWTCRAKPFWKARPKLMLSEIEINLEHQPWRTKSSPLPLCSLFDLGIVRDLCSVKVRILPVCRENSSWAQWNDGNGPDWDKRGEIVQCCNSLTWAWSKGIFSLQVTKMLCTLNSERKNIHRMKVWGSFLL